MELQITQTRHPKSVADGQSGLTTRPAFAKATQVISKWEICYNAQISHLKSIKNKLAITYTIGNAHKILINVTLAERFLQTMMLKMVKIS